jgi:tRNA 2-thiouridine synthesizing protein B
VSSLHTVNKSPGSKDVLESCLHTAAPGDTVLLIEDGVYACASHGHLFNTLDPAIRLCALQEDLQARGIDAGMSPARMESITYPQFVELACQHKRTISWF